jgi:hypothetical protein
VAWDGLEWGRLDAQAKGKKRSWHVARVATGVLYVCVVCWLVGRLYGWMVGVDNRDA